MINLLPEQAIQDIKRLYHKKLVIVAMIFLAIILTASVALLVPSYLVIRSKLDIASKSLDEAKARPVSQQAQALSERVKKINEKIALAGSSVDVQRVRGVVDEILKHKNDDLSFSYIEYSSEGVTLKGYANTRDSFLALNSDLKADPNFSDVTSPISSLIATSSLNFSIRMKHVPKK